jgi:predicted transcriptional regulator
MLVSRYSEETEQRMLEFYWSLNEKDRRRYAGLEADKLGHGGISYISEILGCDRKTVSKGIEELLDPPDLDPSQVRKKGRT